MTHLLFVLHSLPKREVTTACKQLSENLSSLSMRFFSSKTESISLIPISCAPAITDLTNWITSLSSSLSASSESFDSLIWMCNNYRQQVVSFVYRSLVEEYSQFFSVNSSFKGSVSVLAFDHACTVIYYILSRQFSSNVNDFSSLFPMNGNVVSVIDDLLENNINPLISKDTSVVVPPLTFTIDTLITCCSSLPVMMQLNGDYVAGKCLRLPLCRNFYNLIHPQRCSFRIEPLFNSKFANEQPIRCFHVPCPSKSLSFMNDGNLVTDFSELQIFSTTDVSRSSSIVALLDSSDDEVDYDAARDLTRPSPKVGRHNDVMRIVKPLTSDGPCLGSRFDYQLHFSRLSRSGPTSTNLIGEPDVAVFVLEALLCT
ncbi:hypothetical protein RCL1_001991 [Eukaryota sp. TZLM3-RCL]